MDLERLQSELDEIERAHERWSAPLEDAARDDRDTLLAEIRLAAEAAGIDPRPHFEAVATISSTAAPRGGRRPLALMLREFHGYAVLEERRQHRSEGAT